MLSDVDRYINMLLICRARRGKEDCLSTDLRPCCPVCGRSPSHFPSPSTLILYIYMTERRSKRDEENSVASVLPRPQLVGIIELFVD